MDLCAVSTYGCCRDGVTAAGGPDYQGCDEPCQVGGGCCVVNLLCGVVGVAWWILLCDVVGVVRWTLLCGVMGVVW